MNGDYDWQLIVLSMFVAICASYTALELAGSVSRSRGQGAWVRLVGGAMAVVTGVWAMHFIGMLALGIGLAATGLLLVTLMLSAPDARRAEESARLARSLRASNEQLRKLLLYDSLTGLPNRMLLDDRMAQAAAQADRYRQLFALMFVDLDRFKPVNDSFGHGVGDELLKRVAQRLSGCVRTMDTVARVGGDEFVVVLAVIANPGDAAMVGRKILAALSRPFAVGKHEIGISCSIGISVYPGDGRDMTVLKSHADMAMYRAKQEGRNGYRFFTPDMAMAAPAAGR